ncbi:MAG: sec-independent protein translocase protein TatA [Phycisphaerales bacterium]|jgi:sec-independent protein translocase protein TatA|nr:sec-independent protein translocase protein TatA [Phycisphaerales bacterium]MEA2736445.1 sec-independent protein translocase protein TatA [Humisphaera sp.]
MLHTLAITWPGPFEMMLLAGLGLLIFGKRLPEVGRNIGKGIVEFKRGLKEVETEVVAETPTLPDSRQQTAAPTYKYDPYTGKPIEENKPA